MTSHAQLFNFCLFSPPRCETVWLCVWLFRHMPCTRQLNHIFQNPIMFCFAVSTQKRWVLPYQRVLLQPIGFLSTFKSIYELQNYMRCLPAANYVPFLLIYVCHCWVSASGLMRKSRTDLTCSAVKSQRDTVDMKLLTTSTTIWTCATCIPAVGRPWRHTAAALANMTRYCGKSLLLQ